MIDMEYIKHVKPLLYREIDKYFYVSDMKMLDGNPILYCHGLNEEEMTELENIYGMKTMFAKPIEDAESLLSYMA